MFSLEIPLSGYGTTCEHCGVAEGHVVMEHPLLQTDLGRKIDMKGLDQIMVRNIFEHL